MTLRIVKAADPIKVERINLCLYGAPGSGKSSLGFTADAPLLFDFDQGAHRAANRKDTVRVAAWDDVTSISASDLADYRTIIVDTAGRALDALSVDIIKRNPKMGRGGALTLQGYGQLKAEFIAWLKMLNAHGKDVVLITHMDEQRSGDDIIERLDVQGGSKNEIYKAADAMGRVMIRDGKHMLNFNPTDTAFGKNPGQIEPVEIPHPARDPAFLAGIMQQIKDRLNALSAEQQAAQNKVEEWRTRVAEFKTVDQFNAQLAAVKGESKAVQTVFAEAAKAAGLSFDKKAGAYVGDAL